MSQFYLLFNEICKITWDYSQNNLNINQIIVGFTRIYIKYKSLYDDINECDSYLNLLNNLKTKYDNFKKNITKNKRRIRLNGALCVNSKDLTPTKKANIKFIHEFDTPKCKKAHSKVTKKLPKPLPKASKNPKPVKPKPVPSPPPSHPEPQLSQLHSEPSDQPKDNQLETPPAPKTPPSLQNDVEIQKPQTERSNHKNRLEAPKIEPKASDNSKGNIEGASGDAGSSSSGNRNPGCELNDQIGSGDEPVVSSSTSDNGTDTSGSKDIVVDEAKSEANPKGSEQKDSLNDAGNKMSLSSDSSDRLLTSDTNKENSDDGSVGGSEGSNGGSLNIDNGKDDQRGLGGS
ncbi:Plasmodium variant antigen protein Cir/Yir/Bir, putative [Plasmodium chabaudi adami]|uniref:Plasmodium variant antigen protein Cir/Yir/Bir, putative n=1 Tax=Plasmodium chabaudi adami TaxID=5826 RepID=A0A1C6YBP3_PLACE|nr:Plasmodium variant antigen protein Cir/Yir/Bir, putative [Plasmodium chabaudi adami]